MGGLIVFFVFCVRVMTAMTVTDHWGRGYRLSPPITTQHAKRSHVIKRTVWTTPSPSTACCCKARVSRPVTVTRPLKAFYSQPQHYYLKLWQTVGPRSFAPLPSRLTVIHNIHAYEYALTFSLTFNSTEPKTDKASLYNFSKLKKNRKWLKVWRCFKNSGTNAVSK